MELRPEVFKRNRKDVLRIIKYRLVIRNYQIRKSNGVIVSISTFCEHISVLIYFTNRNIQGWCTANVRKVRSNVSSEGPSSEKGRRVFARNVGPFRVYR